MKPTKPKSIFIAEILSIIKFGYILLFSILGSVLILTETTPGSFFNGMKTAIMRNIDTSADPNNTAYILGSFIGKFIISVILSFLIYYFIKKRKKTGGIITLSLMILISISNYKPPLFSIIILILILLKSSNVWFLNLKDNELGDPEILDR